VALTQRKREVLARVIAGETNKEIAGALGLSPETVNHHVDDLLRTFGERSRTGLRARGAG
jgi:DNA-binding NarL/FixJ family response regulator